MKNVIHPFDAAPGPLDNPLKGWCSYTDAGKIYQPYSMIFRYVSWRDLEPREGEYCFAEWEKKSWDVPEAKGRHIVLRVYCDYPGEPTGIPDWLRKRGVRITRYKGEGGGESPDYDNSVLVAAMERLIATLGARYDKHPRVAFLQLGLLGFWGEWHTYTDPGLFASLATTKRVVEAYHRAFLNKKLMARYAKDYPGQQNWLGFHDDYFPEDTGDEGPKKDWYFLYGINRSGRAENWKRAVIGGEMIPNQARSWMGERFDFTLKRAVEAHFSWVGPYTPALEKPISPEYQKRCEQFVRRLGYEYRLTEFACPESVEKGVSFAVTLQGLNQGIAPFYYPWPVRLALLTDSGVVAESVEVSGADIRRWLPGAFRLAGSVTFRTAPPGAYRLAVGIVDPWTGKPAIRFANRLSETGGWSVLCATRLSRTP